MFEKLFGAIPFEREIFPSVNRIPVPSVPGDTPEVVLQKSDLPEREKARSSLAGLSLPSWNRIVPLEFNAVSISEAATAALIRDLIDAPHINLLIQERREPVYSRSLARFNRFHRVDMRVTGSIEEVRERLNTSFSRFGRWTGLGRIPEAHRELWIDDMLRPGEKLLEIEQTQKIFIWLKSVSAGDSKDTHTDVLDERFASKYSNHWWLRVTCTHAGPSMEWMADSNVIRRDMPDSVSPLEAGGATRKPESEYLRDPDQINEIGTHTVVYLKNGIEGRGLFEPPVHRAKIIRSGQRRLRSMMCSMDAS